MYYYNLFEIKWLGTDPVLSRNRREIWLRWFLLLSTLRINWKACFFLSGRKKFMGRYLACCFNFIQFPFSKLAGFLVTLELLFFFLFKFWRFCLLNIRTFAKCIKGWRIEQDGFLFHSFFFISSTKKLMVEV